MPIDASKNINTLNGHYPRWVVAFMQAISMQRRSKGSKGASRGKCVDDTNAPTIATSEVTKPQLKEKYHATSLPSSVSPVNVEADAVHPPGKRFRLKEWIQGRMNQGGDQRPGAGIRSPAIIYERDWTTPFLPVILGFPRGFIMLLIRDPRRGLFAEVQRHNSCMAGHPPRLHDDPTAVPGYRYGSQPEMWNGTISSEALLKSEPESISDSESSPQATTLLGSIVGYVDPRMSKDDILRCVQREIGFSLPLHIPSTLSPDREDDA
ncbi:hypothetical protein EDC04DRAFT_2905263 [Pisolithus marmoratus]|nr:hypothetical protein EDC04DRAFT_2905263 [Pisolithus marmoratus]